jgi:hypothetical protein
MQIVRNAELPITLRCQFVHVARDLYINAEPHEECLKLRPIRTWQCIEAEANAVYEPTMRFGGPRPGVNYERFDDLLDFIRCASPLVPCHSVDA